MSTKESNRKKMKSLKLKTDKYRKARGGRAQLLDVYCNECGAYLLTYQKDGTGRLLRCYCDRILAPPGLKRLQHDAKVRTARDMPNLTCKSCRSLIGTPMKHRSGRLAFRLKPAAIEKQIRR